MGAPKPTAPDFMGMSEYLGMLRGEVARMPPNLKPVGTAFVEALTAARDRMVQDHVELERRRALLHRAHSAMSRRDPDGVAVAEWAAGGGNSAEDKASMDKARSEARKGKEAFTAYWQSVEGSAARPILKTILTELQDLALAADEAAKSADNPFEADPNPAVATDPELEAQIMRELAERNAALES